MMKTDLTSIDFKAKIKTGAYSQRSFPSKRSKTFLGRLLEETTSRLKTGCTNQDWQFDFVCPVLLDRFRRAKSELFTLNEKSKSFLVDGMNDATILCEYLSTMIGDQNANRFKCWNINTRDFYQSGKVLSINSKR